MNCSDRGEVGIEALVIGRADLRRDLAASDGKLYKGSTRKSGFSCVLLSHLHHRHCVRRLSSSTMPSLRRTASSPAVRLSPYTSGSLVARGHGPRRSSGSETSSRRVLADIEWWRVTDGQCTDASADQESEDPNRGTQGTNVLFDAADAVPVTHVDADASVEHTAALPMPWAAPTPAGSLETPSPDLPTEQFSTLSITPHTPRRRHHTLESSSSSLESSPEAAEAPAAHALALGLGLHLNFDALPTLHTLSPQRRTRYSAPTPLLRRSFTIADCGMSMSLDDHEDHATQYADFAVSPLSSAPDFLN
ncbi:unnamed protein product [Cyclocybe aegerita]|uniref:Uncharacterized protein n=1 Tax=Cyclocybe aegerita TaxID=1973307 RepID=A0A8S0WCQ2_CYCAE|nr:unnamed protein product [Cyclocybe aegerita]